MKKNGRDVQRQRIDDVEVKEVKTVGISRKVDSPSARKCIIIAKLGGLTRLRTQQPHDLDC